MSSRKHFFRDVGQLKHKGPIPCLQCGQCSGHGEEQDLLVAGFPCKPYSGANPSRFRGKYNFHHHKDTLAFIQIREHIDSMLLPPRVIVLENVDGVQRQRRNSGDKTETPAEFIMHGKLGGDGKVNIRLVGLSYLENYHVRPTAPQCCASYGLPLVRTRLFWVLLRTDCYKVEEMELVMHKLAIIKGYRIPVSPLTAFVERRTLSRNFVLVPLTLEITGSVPNDITWPSASSGRRCIVRTFARRR